MAQAGISAPELPAELAQRAIGPSDEGYDEARSLFYGGLDKRPALIVRAANAQDVAHVVELARERGVELAVRSGGHSVAGHSTTEGGIVLDLSEMRALEIDPERRTAWVETGLTTGAYTDTAASHGLATGFGDSGSVGIGGLTLGGGVGFLLRKHGLTIDHLVAAEVVTADGALLRVDPSSHPDLFWAIRGGGGNFGVATRLKLRLHDVGTVVGGLLFLPATPQTIAGFVDEAERAPRELSTIANVMKAPPMPTIPEEAHGSLVIFAFLCYAGDPERGQQAVAPFRKLAPPIADMVRPMSYPEMYLPEEEGYHPVASARTMFLDTVDETLAERVLDTIPSTKAMMSVAQIRVLGGAMADVPPDATAFAHRGSKIMVNVGAVYQDPEERSIHESWVDAFTSSLRQSDTGAYVNFLGDEGAGRVRAAYPGATWERLRRVKARYDPENVFHLNQNIPPANDAEER
jgi:FAD/FMN-containing dehydrogenase